MYNNLRGIERDKTEKVRETDGLESGTYVCVCTVVGSICVLTNCTLLVIEKLCLITMFTRVCVCMVYIVNEEKASNKRNNNKIFSKNNFF